MRRRTFLTTAAAAGALTALPVSAAAAGTVLALHRRIIEVNGKPAAMLGISQPDGTQGLFTEATRPFRVRVQNHLNRPSLIHWHGLTPPFRQDGVPYVSAPPIPAGGSQDYDFTLAFPGTFWMHSHVSFQEQELLSAPLIIHDAAPGHGKTREVVVMLHDFTFRDPREIMAGLKKGGAPAGMAMPGMSGMAMAGAKPDLNDVDFDAFLANDRTLADPEVVRIEPGAQVRLRLINASAATNYWIDLGALNGTLIAVDGAPVKPMTVRTLPLAIAQRADVLVALPGAGAFPLLAQVEGRRERTGIILAPPRAAVARIAEHAARPTPALGFVFERSLRAARPLPPRSAEIARKVLLSGDMRAYVWTMDNQVYPRITPIMIEAGKRVEFALQNVTMMSHPMHLHGHRFQVVGIDRTRFPGAVRDTVLVPPLKTVTIAFDAGNQGRWAFHCHNLYHLAAGMMAVVDYDGVPMPRIPKNAG